MTGLIRRNAALMLAVITLLAFLPGLIVQAGTSSVKGLVFFDGEENGVPDAGERGLDNAELTLIKVSGASESIVKQVRSGEDGSWAFEGVEAGDYYLQVSLPLEYYHVLYEGGQAVTLPAQGRHSRTTEFTLGEGETITHNIPASKKNAYITITAFGDLNMNGGRMSSEPLLRDVQVELLYTREGREYVITTGKTDREGILQFRELTPATYHIRATMPEPYIVGPLGAKFNPFYNVIKPGQNNVGISEPFTIERSQGMGIGGVKAGSLSGKIWMDSNMDGVMDANEGGYAGLVLTLTHLGMDVTRTITTTEEAGFTFEYLQAGEYSLTAELPEGVMFALPGSQSVFHDGYAQTQSVNIQVTEDQPATLSPIGVMPASSIRLFAFLDSNVNGLLDESEPSFMNAQVDILSGETVMTSVMTDAQGQAYFPRVRDGEITVQVSLPDGQVFTIPGGDEGNAFASVSAASSLKVTKALQKGETLSLYAGATLPGAVSGVLFDDNNLNSALDNNEAGLSGFTVQAIDQNDNVAASVMTGENGAYELTGLVPGDYKVRILLVSPYIFSQASQSSQGQVNKVVSQTVAYGETETIAVGPGSAVENVDAGAFRSAVVQGAVLLGDEETGFLETASGLQGVKITLLDENKAEVSEYTVAVTDESGKFLLKGALPGTYYLSFTLPEDAKFSRPLSDEITYISDSVTLKASDEMAISPIYAVKTGTISGQAFYDADNNGVFNENDQGLSAVSVELVNNKTLESYETQSDENGVYRLSGIRPGNYEATVILPEGYAIDFNEYCLVPYAITGQSSATHDIGMGQRMENTLIPALKPITISGSAFYDNDLSKSKGTGDTAYPTQVTLLHKRTESAATFNTDEAGNFTLENMFPGVYQMSLTLPQDFLVFAPEATNDASGLWKADVRLEETNPILELAVVQLGRITGSVWNMDGSMNDVSGIEVKLIDDNGVQVRQANTDANGGFAFTGLMPVNYRLAATLPGEYRFARQMDTASRPSVILSDSVGMEATVGQSELIKLNMGEQKTAQDIGMGALGRLGDYAWLDTDGDGMQDGGEPGIPGLQINLYQYGQLTNQAVTDQYGRYLFDKIYPGSYTIKVEMPNEIKPTIRQTDFKLVASVLEPTNENTATAEGVIVPSGGRNLNADLGFVLRQDNVYPDSLQNLPQKDWTRINEQQPRR